MQIDLIQMMEAIGDGVSPSMSAPPGAASALGETGFALLFAQMRAQLLGQLAGEPPAEPVENRPEEETASQDLSWLSLAGEQWAPLMLAMSGAAAGNTLEDNAGPEALLSINGSTKALPAAVAGEVAVAPQFNGFDALPMEVLSGVADTIASPLHEGVPPAAASIDAVMPDSSGVNAAPISAVRAPSVLVVSDVLLDVSAAVDAVMPGSEGAAPAPEASIPTIRISHAEYRVNAAPENPADAVLPKNVLAAELAAPDLVVEVAGAEKAATPSVTPAVSEISSAATTVSADPVIEEVERVVTSNLRGAVNAAPRAVAPAKTAEDVPLKTAMEGLPDAVSKVSQSDVQSGPVTGLERLAASAVNRASGRRIAVLTTEKAVKTLASASRVEEPPPGPAEASIPLAVASEIQPRIEAPAKSVEVPSSHVTLETVSAHTVRNVRYLVLKGERTITVRLVPESLGEMRLDVQSGGEGLSIRLASANPVVRDALETQVHGLREALARDGINVAKVEISSTMSYMADSGSRFSQETGQPPQTFMVRAPLSAEHAYTNARPEETSTLRRASMHDGPLNVFV